jgi:hypothetical protein
VHIYGTYSVRVPEIRHYRGAPTVRCRDRYSSLGIEIWMVGSVRFKRSFPVSGRFCSQKIGFLRSSLVFLDLLSSQKVDKKTPKSTTLESSIFVGERRGLAQWNLQNGVVSSVPEWPPGALFWAFLGVPSPVMRWVGCWFGAPPRPCSIQYVSERVGVWCVGIVWVVWSFRCPEEAWGCCVHPPGVLGLERGWVRGVWHLRGSAGFNNCLRLSRAG